ncbi:MAG: hypothetical protein JWP92_3029 [Caulobacter sp.]|nr:hypothetical protein [Caulobacter sp.]
MADGHFPDVELLRRELAALILEWAGKAVKDDPDGPLSTALTRAVGEAARGAITEQHQILAADAADRIAEALERRGKTGGLFVWRAPALGLGLAAVAAVTLFAVAFLLGLQAGRKEDAPPPAPATATAAGAAPVAPLAPAADEPAPSSVTPRIAAPHPLAAPQRSAPAPAKPAKPASRPPPREQGRPAPATDQTSPRSTQPVGAATTAPAAPAPAKTP